MPGPTPHADVNAALKELLAYNRHVLGENLIGLYLHGSLATGGFDPYSDVDFIIVVKSELDESTAKALQESHQFLFDSQHYWAKHLEGSYISAEMLRDLGQAGQALWYFDHGSTTIERSDHCNSLVLRWVLYEKGITVFGPPPQSLIEPIATADLQREILHTMQSWGAEMMDDPSPYMSEFYQVFICINYCRMLHDLQHGSINAKAVGVTWALQHLDRRWHELIINSWQRRRETPPDQAIALPPDPADFVATFDFVRYTIKAGEKWAAEQGL